MEKQRFVHAGMALPTMNIQEVTRYFRDQEREANSRDKENQLSQRRAARNGGRNNRGKRNHGPPVAKTEGAPPPKKAKTTIDGSGPHRGGPRNDDPCPVHAYGEHTWGSCRRNADNVNRRSRNTSGNDAKPTPDSHYSNKATVTKTKVAAVAQQQDNAPMETEGTTLNFCFTVDSMIQLDEYLTSESCSCEQIELSTSLCASFYATLEECFASGEECTEITTPVVFSNPVNPNPKLRPIGMMTIGSIQKLVFRKPL
jgi:hypothetical protein